MTVRDSGGILKNLATSPWHDIIAFQVTKKYREPRVVWVNVYANGSMGGVLYDTKDEAEKKVRGMREVKQVKFVEVIEE